MKKLLTLLLLTFVVIGCGDKNALEANYVEGVNYRALATPIATNGEQIEVMEFFWYGCPHCESFEQPLHQWQKTMAADVDLVQSPAIWNDLMKLHAKVFFIVQNMADSDKAHAALFQEVMALREIRDSKLQTQKLADFLQNFGLSQADFERQLASAEINQQLAQAIEVMAQSEIDGTPSIVVNGRYLVLNQSANSFEQVLDITRFLVEKEKGRLAVN
ncbi:thiol:disulfide interchange protein DsbA/DsbL [Shewanella kaireitica]|uniref:thiol:disulfide interchange protein DsbA/DsbL n=1 Tax=Shewanella kaireitica TaxID=212021 RepID=UPI0020106821|nr:thiol:disulfide interchange protein DsbA/DsbL [Shewanella kaireitica]MCL1093942.1 thiol:disulfide interchange protein DsbA/DsbL [Shewanella kaireitica]